MATRTAPATSTTPTTTATIHLIDKSGDLFTDAITMPAAMTAANIETLAAAYQAASQLSVWKISQSLEWVGDADPDNADVGQRNSAKDGINLLYKNLTTLRTQTPRLAGPIGAVMQGNQDIPLLSATEMTALIAAYQTLLTGFTLTSAQYTERRERFNNPRIKA